MNIDEICTREVIIASRSDSALEVVKLMRQYHVGDVIIVDRIDNQNIPVGIITDRDIVLELVAKEIDVSSVCAGDIMSTELLLAVESEQLSDVVQKMQAKGVRRAPVVDGQGRLIGIVTGDDLIEMISEQLGSLVSLVNKREQREHTLRT